MEAEAEAAEVVTEVAAAEAAATVAAEAAAAEAAAAEAAAESDDCAQAATTVQRHARGMSVRLLYTAFRRTWAALVVQRHMRPRRLPARRGAERTRATPPPSCFRLGFGPISCAGDPR